MSHVPESAGPPFGPPPNPPSSGRSSLLGCAFALSFILNLVGGLVVLIICLGVFVLRKPDTVPLGEKHYSGQSHATDKVAIITLDGVILEGLLGYANKQIEQAAGDHNVKAIVLRINSPGGSITASDDLYRKLIELRDGNPKKGHASRPLIVSMGGLAASGGYYVAMPGQTVFAEPTTLTGSIGVYTSFPNVKKLADQYGVAVNTIKQGQIKDSGSPFAELTPHERQVWQDMVNDAYQRFVHVVEKGRPMLSGGKLIEPLTITPTKAGPSFLKAEADKKEPYTRYLADGGVWTAENALKYKLVDKIGTLDDAVQAAHDAANLSDNYQAIKYERPSTLADLLGLGAHSSVPPSGSVLDPARLEAGFAPRLWYLAPGAELSGLFAAMRE
ncbi:MAG TPA: signal peptide peptidase SppA [Gemmataceae bacterium]|nr:signal peptide peptidase SppA [Gemmataceae bacterium]